MVLSPARSGRGAARVALLLVTAALLFLVPLSYAVAAPAAASTGHSSGLERTSAPDWMGRLPDSANLAGLSIPGTHDSMAFDSSIISLTQDSDLPEQLRAGVRALDIRTRHYRDSFPIHHGSEYLHADFADVVRDTTDFLRDNPTETVLMRIRSEHTEAENTRSFEATLNWYVEDNPDTRDRLRDHLWRPPAGYDGRVPDLGETRGRIVILQDFDSSVPYGPRWGGDRTDIQDEYHLPTLFHVPQKWDLVRSHFERTDQGAPDVLHVNHLSASGGALPVSVAKGALGVTGMNERALDHLEAGNVRRTGTVMADFPGPALVEAVIARNLP
ncbi:phosphatidylinositol-specific phospholipase C [Actinorugispora endophytica]|uniref:1-phosphatidylinositol phosphodiesterase n=1 Tax=Actinorugispora endophytica TaxID=1605990 RepID=A0A4R6V797_9ACTN|nr:phosphatidylinositol-specific phospholipase C [Actinorugispora endophytica]TDQ55092.1 1-phosphatidylinositol phosphodiesterase [Actinorugispora endophytica]